MPARTVFNVNVPDLPLNEIKGIQLTRLGHRARAAAPVLTINPRGKKCYWLASVGEVEDGEEGTDFHAVSQGYVSITPLQLDRTFHAQMDNVKHWLEGVM